MLVRRLTAGLVGVALVAACSGGDGDGGEGGSSGDDGASATTETSAPASTSMPPDGTAAPSSTPPVPPASSGGEGDRATLPDVVGMDLQLAQDTMQASGFYLLTSHDATGQDRFQVVDRNWTVCSQDPPGDTEASVDTLIDFGAVKDDEACP
jgi:hypothetical protein